MYYSSRVVKYAFESNSGTLWAALAGLRYSIYLIYVGDEIAIITTRVRVIIMIMMDFVCNGNEMMTNFRNT